MPMNPLPFARRHVRALLALLVGAVLLAAAALPTARYVQARRHLHAAEAALQQRDFDRAAEQVTAYLALRPQDPRGWFLAARAARQAGRFAQAEHDLERCQQLGGVTDATRLEWDLWRVQQGDLQGVEGRLKATIPPSHPDAALVLEALARGYLKRDRLRDAVEALNLWLGLRPQAEALTLLGWTLERLGRSADALRAYRQAVGHGGQREARLRLARLLLRQHQPAEAAEQLEHLRALSPEDAEVLAVLGACRLEQGRAEEAARLLDRALAEQPDRADALAARGQAALVLNQPGRAEGWLQAAVARAPDDREALNHLVRCLRRLHRDAEARRRQRDLERLTADLRRLEELIRAVALEPHDPELRRQAGVLALRLGQTEEGLRWLYGALREDPGHRPTHATLAEHFRRHGQPERADRHRRLAAGTSAEGRGQ
jgi:tetratricopeptide (TPR) repeat protein